MADHPIEGLMITAMNSIQDMVDVNTIIGEPIETSNHVVIIPISKVSFGFAAGGSEFKGETIDEYTKKDKEEAIQYRLPFGGGSGAGVNINPVAFLVIQDNNIRLLPVNYTSAVDKLLDYVPDLIEKTNNIINKTIIDKKQEEIKTKDTKQDKSAKDGISEKLEKSTEKTKPRRNRKPYEIEYDETELDDDDIIDEYIQKSDD